MIKIIVLSCAMFALLFGMNPAEAFGEEETVNFILPETPPTIERVKKPPLDRPFLKKQNFISEFDISPAPVFLGLNFRKFGSETAPVSVGMYSGSFASRGGSFAYSSTNTVDASYSSAVTEGEYPNLERASHAFRARCERKPSADKYYYLEIKNGDTHVWDQQSSLLGAAAGFGWYPRHNLNAKVGISYSKGELKGQDINESDAGSISMLWQPLDGHNASLSFAPNADTSIGLERRFDTASARYDVMLFSKVVIGGGGRVTKDKQFAQGYLAANLAPGLKLSVNYAPGIEKISWDKLFISDNYIQVNKDILYPESVYSFTENLSYYAGENNSVELEISQAHWKNYVIWESLPGTGFITPVNEPEVYAASARLKAVFGGKLISCRISAERSLNCELPFVPDNSCSAGIEAYLGTWTLGAGCKYTGAMYFRRGLEEKLAACENMSASVRKTAGENVEFYASCDNLLSKRLESQPGFVRNAPVFYAGINLKL